MYTAREENDRRDAPRGDRPYGRRIDCCAEENTRNVAATPARGGGRPAPEAWAAHDSRS
ncbi:MAG TPA: hypothetical protein VGB92_17370 [Longimicrobium sp.]